MPLSDEESMMPSLREFFSYEYNFEILKEFIDGRKHTRAQPVPEPAPVADSHDTRLSFGLLDWFNVNYSKHYGVEYKLYRLGRERTIYVWQAYNAALNGYGKERFDPFARGKSKGGAIIMTLTVSGKEESITTTLRQLNYFRWAIENGVINFVKTHVDEIYTDFITRSNRGKEKQLGTKKEKLSVSASKSLGIHKVKMTVKIDKIPIIVNSK
jgi:hypothetical protein